MLLNISNGLNLTVRLVDMYRKDTYDPVTLAY